MTSEAPLSFSSFYDTMLHNLCWDFIHLPGYKAEVGIDVDFIEIAFLHFNVS